MAEMTNSEVLEAIKEFAIGTSAPANRNGAYALLLSMGAGFFGTMGQVMDGKSSVARIVAKRCQILS
jgi:hypothetical protein